MQIYLVGGAIRDRLLGLPTPYEQDWVVVNGTPDELINKGYIKVGTVSYTHLTLPTIYSV